MKTHLTVIRPVEVQFCRDCRFAVHVAEDSREDHTLVWCARLECDNTNPERLHSVKREADNAAHADGRSLVGRTPLTALCIRLGAGPLRWLARCGRCVATALTAFLLRRLSPPPSERVESSELAERFTYHDSDGPVNA